MGEPQIDGVFVQPAEAASQYKNQRELELGV